jgi:hypothetical protein
LIHADGDSYVKFREDKLNNRLVIGFLTELRVEVDTTILMVPFMLASGLKMLSQDMEGKHGQMEQNMKANLDVEKKKVKDNSNGRMVLGMRENSMIIILMVY